MMRRLTLIALLAAACAPATGTAPTAIKGVTTTTLPTPPADLGRFTMWVDDAGIPFSDYGVYRDIEIGVQRSVLSVAERGLLMWNQWYGGEVLLSYDWERWPENKESEPESREEARSVLVACADWMLANVIDEGPYLVWRYPYPMSYNTSAGWASAHAQAVGLQLLAKAYDLTEEPRYLEPFEGLVAAFDVTVEEGGLLDLTGDVYWFEKMADPEGNDRPKVLNGMLFALLGLHDVSDRVDTHHLYERGLESVLATIERYDLGNWSSYDVTGKPASEHYHRIHVAQLDFLHEIEGGAELAAWRDRFASYSAR